jgi:hypothetical protein
MAQATELALQTAVRISDAAARTTLVAAGCVAAFYLLLSCFFAPRLANVFAGVPRGRSLASAYPARCVFVIVYAALMAAVVACVAAAVVLYKADASNVAVVLLAVVAPLVFAGLALLCCFAVRAKLGDGPRGGGSGEAAEKAGAIDI